MKNLIVTDDRGHPQSDADIAFIHRKQTLRDQYAAGLLDDQSEPINATECPATYTISDGTAAGWNGPLGDYVRCELPRNHDGDHIFTVEWNDQERDDLHVWLR